MVRTRKKKKRNYKKAPKNTRVFRCVQKVKKKNDIGAAIAICQSSTKQSYRTGKTLKKKGGGNTASRRISHRCPGPNAPPSTWYQPEMGDIVEVKKNFEDMFILAKQQFKKNDLWKILEISQARESCIVKLIKMEKIEASNKYKKKVPRVKRDITYIYYTNIAGNPGGRDDNFRLIKRKTPEVSDKPPTVVSQEKAKALGWGQLGGRRKKKTRKKRGGNGDTGNWYYITNSNGESFYGGVIAQYDNLIVLLIADGDTAFQWSSISFRKDNLSFSDPITDMDRISNSALSKAIKDWTNKGEDVEIIVKRGMLETPPQSPRKGGSKSKRVKRLIKIFQQYPEIFPSGYFRFLGARLQNHIDKKTLWYKNGVILTWIKYQKTVKKKPKCIIKPGDVKLDQIVNKNQGNGAAKKIVLHFLKKFKKNRIWLEVRANNKRAIRFYKDRGFKRVCKIKFGEIPGIMMLKQV